MWRSWQGRSKKILPETILWLGGPEVSYDAVDVLTRLRQVTGVMKGEGEETFLELLEYYHGRRETLEAIAGITFRTENGEIREKRMAGRYGSKSGTVCI